MVASIKSSCHPSSSFQSPPLNPEHEVRVKDFLGYVVKSGFFRVANPVFRKCWPSFQLAAARPLTLRSRGGPVSVKPGQEIILNPPPPVAYVEGAVGYGTEDACTSFLRKLK